MTNSFPHVSDTTTDRYLLGTLPPAEVERLDELSIVDADFAARLAAAEIDLADAYARGELSPDDAQRWERTHLVSREGRAQLRLAQALADRERREGSGRHALRSWVAVLATAAAVVLVAGGVYLARRAAPLPVAPATAAVNRSVAAPASSARPEPVAPPLVFAATLLPGTRGAGNWDKLTIPKDTAVVRLTLWLEPNDFNRFDVSIRNAVAAKAAWAARGLVAHSVRGGRALTVEVPPATLAPGRYLIDVAGVGAGSSEVIATYPVEAVVQ